MAAREREGAGYRFGAGVAGSWARSGRGLEWFPGSSFIFFFPLFFSFSIFLFLSQILQNAPNQFKPLSEIL
jgi:hypothetical protein